ncbi:DUF2380 domain-containing protein [Aquamicrobium sp. LC103]|uniref:DUF2380 domain-containing protein n=1 Tax=Aquamicrobium sp. LC103 TaxID=1120658 RepID=UPI00069A4451|nr:DUF2380 domain-containing protein [Aquamicrobium sp. LC103]
MERATQPTESRESSGACRSLLLACALACFLSSPIRADENRISLALADYFLADTSGEERDQTAEHAARLAHFDEILHDELAVSDKFELVEIDCLQPRCTGENMRLKQLLELARQAGARFLAVGAVNKMSTLVLWSRVEVYDVTTGKMVFDRLITFRGDNDEAWRRTALYTARELIRNAPAGKRG